MTRRITVTRLSFTGPPEAEVIIRPSCTATNRRDAPKDRVCLSVYTGEPEGEAYLRPSPAQAREIAAALVEAANLTDPPKGAAE